MAATTAPADKISANFKIQQWDHDPGGTGAVIVSPDAGTTKRVIDMRDYSSFMLLVTPVVATSTGVTLIEIVAATDSAMTTPILVKAHAATVLDALDDYAELEITDQDLQELSTADLRYVAGRITMSNALDEARAFYIAKAKRPRLDLTALNQT